MANIVRHRRLPCASHAVKGHVGGDVSFERLPKVVRYFSISSLRCGSWVGRWLWRRFSLLNSVFCEMNLSKMLESMNVHLRIYTNNERVLGRPIAMLLVSPSPLICLSTGMVGSDRFMDCFLNDGYKGAR